MIKTLANDIALSKVNLTQALTQAKIIAYQIDNKDFKSWISYELRGYNSKAKLPDYRFIQATSVGWFVDRLGREFESTLTLPEELIELSEKEMHQWRVLESIPSLERIIDSLPGKDFYYTQLSQEVITFFSSAFNYSNNVTLKSVLKKIAISDIFNIINESKQRLLDTLLELNSEFPELENEDIDKLSKEKADKIITTNIYGNISNSNLGFGDHFTQKQEIHQNQINETIQKLKKLGVEDKDIDELLEVIKSKNGEKKPIHKKLMNWAGKVVQKSVEKGIELQVPEVLELLSNI